MSARELLLLDWATPPSPPCRAPCCTRWSLQQLRGSFLCRGAAATVRPVPEFQTSSPYSSTSTRTRTEPCVHHVSAWGSVDECSQCIYMYRPVTSSRWPWPGRIRTPRGAGSRGAGGRRRRRRRRRVAASAGVRRESTPRRRGRSKEAHPRLLLEEKRRAEGAGSAVADIVSAGGTAVTVCSRAWLPAACSAWWSAG